MTPSLVHVPGRLIVVAFDPGVSTGWCTIAACRNSVLRKGTREWLRELRHDVELSTLDPVVAGLDLGMDYGVFGKDFGSARGDDRRADEMMAMVRRCWEQWQPDPDVDVFAVVAESFTLREMNSGEDLLTPVRLNAKVERDMLRGGLYLHQQTPSDAKSIVTDARLRSWNVYSPASGVHARDAQRHAILFARKWASNPTMRKGLGNGHPRT